PTFHVDLLTHKVASSGINVGANPLQAVAPGGRRTYWFFADTDHIGAGLISDLAGAGSSTPFGKLQHGAPELSGVDGLYGAMVVSAPGATFTVPDGPAAGTATDV